jgi:hypothetical protein
MTAGIAPQKRESDRAALTAFGESADRDRRLSEEIRGRLFHNSWQDFSIPTVRPGGSVRLGGEVRMQQYRCGVIIVLGALAMSACAAAPRARPLPTGRVEEGPNSTTAVRKQFEGHWALVSFSVNGADGRQTPVDATGDLTFDGFGVLQVQYKMSDAGLKALASVGVTSPNPVISTTGRVVIDTQQNRITYIGDDFEERALGFDPKLAAARANPFALERIRYYKLDAGMLTLSTRYEDGKDAAVSQWKRAP